MFFVRTYVQRFLYVACMLTCVLVPATPVSIDVRAQTKRAVPVDIVMVREADEGSEQLEALAHTVAHDISFMGSCYATVRSGKFSKQELERSAQKQKALVIFIKKVEEHKWGWFVYDAIAKSECAHGFYSERGAIMCGWAHAIAQGIYAALTGKQGIFTMKLVYCKDVAGSRPVKHICLADYDGTNEQVLVSTARLNLAPRWNRDPYNPLVFYSESGEDKTRLKWIDLNKKVRGLCDDDGLNMQISFCGNGTQAIYVASRGTGCCQLYHWKKGMLKRLTHNSGNNLSPSFSDDGTSVVFCSDCRVEESTNDVIVFCSDMSKRDGARPQIYRYDFAEDTTHAITRDGFCVSPAYNQKKGQIIYSKLLGGTLQLMLYDCATAAHSQLTFDQGDKQEASWSSCGEYVLFSISKSGSSQLALLEVESPKEYKVLPLGQGAYSYPDWSDRFYEFPVVSG